MRIKLGEVEALFRYPVKSMCGEVLDLAELGRHGIEGDRRLAFRRVEDRGGFPWLTASKLPELILHVPLRLGSTDGELPTHIRTPEGQELTVFSQELTTQIGTRHGSPVAMMHLNRGIFDVASISVISSATVNELGKLAEHPPDVRRFRPNILIKTLRSIPFEEDGWVGGVLSFGEGGSAASVTVTERDERCSMVCFDPDSAHTSPEVLKTIVRLRNNKAGIYAAVTRQGRIETGQAVFFEATDAMKRFGDLET